MVTRNITRAATATVTKRAVVIASLHSTDNADSNVHDGAIDPFKGKSIHELKTKHQSPFFEVEYYYSSDSSMSSLRKASLPQSKAESSPTSILLAMMVGAVNFEEEFAV